MWWPDGPEQLLVIALVIKWDEYPRKQQQPHWNHAFIALPQHCGNMGDSQKVRQPLRQALRQCKSVRNTVAALHTRSEKVVQHGYSIKMCHVTLDGF